MTMDESSRRRHSSTRMDESSRRRNHSFNNNTSTPVSTPTRQKTPTTLSPIKPTTRSSKRRAPLLRYVLSIVGIGTLATFLLQAMSLSSHSQGGISGTDHPIPLAIFAGKRQLGSQDAFANIADQVRAQIKEQALEAEVKEVEVEVNDKPTETPPKSNSRAVFLEEDEEEEEDNFEIPLKPESKPKKEPAIPDDFSNAPPPRNLTKDDEFAACLLIKDDNHWLIEWLAYHYHVMPLRRLVVAIDPDSQTSPEKIFERWSFLMKITTWKDDEFMKGNPAPARMLKAYPNNTQLMHHRHRQNTFYIKCLQQFKKERIPWVHLTDTDEFIAINYASGPLYNLTKHHSILTPGSVLRFLNHHQDATGDTAQCIFMPRYMFGNKESPKALVERNVPKSSNVLHGKDFLTQRFMFRHPTKMQNGKNLVHLSAIRAFKPMANVHRVSASCPTHDSQLDVNFIKSTLVKVHHYLGTKQQYFFRMDPRGESANATQSRKGVGNYYLRDSQRYDQLNVRAIYSDSGARGWIRGFVKNVGVPMAEFLLEGIGRVGVE